MGFRRYMVFAALLSCGISTSEVLASTLNLSTDPQYAEGFIFYCPPYELPFVTDNHYLPTSVGCIYSIPSEIRAQGEKVYIMLYRGTPGSATLLRSEPVVDGTTPPTLVQLFSSGGFEGYGAVAQDMSFFGVVLPSGPLENFQYPQIDQFNNYFESGSSTAPHNNYHISSWKWGAKPPSEFDPVIIIPGILGSWEKNGEWILDPILHIYDNLVDTLLANGYIKDKTLFTFPYDWRNSNILTANLLKEKINQIKTICGCEYVDLVGHSMGGLVAGQYISSIQYANDVDQVIFVATPFLGSPKAYKTWEAGEVDFGILSTDVIMKRIFEREARDNGFDTIFSYIQQRPVSSLQELLPSYSYLTDTEESEIPYPSEHPRNTFLEGLSQALFSKIQLTTVRASVLTSDNNLFNTTSGYTVQTSTQPPFWPHGEPVQEHTYSGDGTVPTISLDGLGEITKSFTDVDHTTLASTSAQYIFELLNTVQPATLVGKIRNPLYDADYSVLIDKLSPSAGDAGYYTGAVAEFLLKLNPLIDNVLTIVLYSPVDMEITSPDGKRLGKDSSTGTILHELPQARYSNVAGEHEYAIILNPLPGTYKIKTLGTENGTYTLAVGVGSRTTSTTTLLNNHTNTGEVVSHTLNLSSSTAVVTVDTTPTPITPESCVADMQLAYKNKWITKKSIYNELVADCKLLKVLFLARDKATTSKVRTGIIATIKLTLHRMDQLAKDKSNRQEAVQLIVKNTTWFRTNEVK